jgi:ABC-type sugar transport system ATPase subunit
MESSNNIKTLKAQGLTHSYKIDSEAVLAVHEVSFSVDRSAFISITGRSGSGKTTLLHLIAGLIKPDSGEILVENTEITSLDDESMTVFFRIEQHTSFSEIRTIIAFSEDTAAKIQNEQQFLMSVSESLCRHLCYGITAHERNITAH